MTGVTADDAIYRTETFGPLVGVARFESFGPLGMALISQECGVSGLASLGLNAMAPDEGNMHTLLIAGTESSSRPTCVRSRRAGSAPASR